MQNHRTINETQPEVNKIDFELSLFYVADPTNSPFVYIYIYYDIMLASKSKAILNNNKAKKLPKQKYFNNISTFYRLNQSIV